jgi:hypothetical protein
MSDIDTKPISANDIANAVFAFFARETGNTASQAPLVLRVLSSPWAASDPDFWKARDALAEVIGGVFAPGTPTHLSPQIR